MGRKHLGGKPIPFLHDSARTEIGLLLIERRDAIQGTLLRHWLHQQILPTFANRILPVDAAVALRCATLHVPDPLAERDALTAATALVHGLTVVTRNVTDFQETGVTLLKPWQTSPPLR